MTDDLSADSSVQNTEASNTNSSNNTSSQSLGTAAPNLSTSKDSDLASTSAPAPVRQEKTFTRDEVAKIVNAEKNKAIDRFRQENHQPTSTTGDSITDERVRSLVQQESQRLANEAVGNRIASEFVQKLEAAKDKYPDFEQSVAELNLPTIPHIVSWANSLDNTADVIYDIAKNPEKYAELLLLSHTAPQMAQRKMQSLSKSIKDNEAAKNQALPNEPLSQKRHSTTGTDNGSMSISDLRKQDWLRG